MDQGDPIGGPGPAGPVAGRGLTRTNGPGSEPYIHFIHHTYTIPQYDFTTNIAPSGLCTTTITQQSASIVQMVSDLSSKLLLARNGRLKLFSFMEDPTPTNEALVTTWLIYLRCYL